MLLIMGVCGKVEQPLNNYCFQQVMLKKWS